MDNNIGRYTQIARIKKGMTQEQLAEKTGISWSAISRFETGQSMLSVARLIKVAEALDIGMEVLLADYVRVPPEVKDPVSQEIMRRLSICTDAEKEYVLENLELVLRFWDDKK